MGLPIFGQRLIIRTMSDQLRLPNSHGHHNNCKSASACRNWLAVRGCGAGNWKSGAVRCVVAISDGEHVREYDRVTDPPIVGVFRMAGKQTVLAASAWTFIYRPERLG